MIRKIILTSIIFCVIISCGKKGDPEYKDPESTIKLQINSGK